MQDFKDWTKAFVCKWWILWEKDGWFAITTRKITPAAAALVRDCHNNVALVKIFRPAVDAFVLELPRGGAEEGEAGIEAARREAEEETGLDLSQARVTDLGRFHPDSGVAGFDSALVMFELTTPFPKTFSPDHEVERVVVMPWDTFLEKVGSGEIKDSFAATALLRILHAKRAIFS